MSGMERHTVKERHQRRGFATWYVTTCSCDAKFESMSRKNADAAYRQHKKAALAGEVSA